MDDPTPTESARMWHVTLSVARAEVEPREIRAGLERLAHEHPFLLNGRYASDRAEVSYWEEAADVADAAILALRLWETHRATRPRLPSGTSWASRSSTSDLPAPGSGGGAHRPGWPPAGVVRPF